jgi:hypothetical protein
MKITFLFFVTLLLTTLGASAAELRLKNNERATINPNVATTVYCGGGSNSRNDDRDQERCSSFKSSSSCSGLLIGTICDLYGKTGVCVQNNSRGYGPECKCAAN